MKRERPLQTSNNYCKTVEDTLASSEFSEKHPKLFERFKLEQQA